MDLEPNNDDLYQVAKQVENGFKEGMIDSEDDDGRPVRITFEIVINKFYND